MNTKFLVGSRYFFNNIEGFSSKDEDILELILIHHNFKNMMQIHDKGHCCFRLSKVFPQEFIRITIDRLNLLKSLVNKLDEKHLYDKVIYEACITNNGFYLPEEQLLNACNEYKNYRK